VIERRFSITDPKIRVTIRSGRIAVTSGEPGSIHVTVDTSDPGYEIVQRGDVVEVSSRRGGRAFVTARVPPGSDVELASAGADISIDQRLRRLDVSTASGDVVFESAERLQAKTASGDVRGSRVTGEARCVTASGNIELSLLQERADLSTASGDISIGEASGDIACASVSGDVRIGRLTGPSLVARSMSGTVSIGVLPGTRLDLDANTLSGRIRLPSPPAHPEPPQRETSVKVRLVSGDLRVERVA
jgi:DUF4097 and DUF4098 domain-containing protein YvlB